MRKHLFVFLIVLLAAAVSVPALAQRAGQPDADAVAELLAAGSEPVTVLDLLLNERFDNNRTWQDFKASNSSGTAEDGEYIIRVDADYYAWTMNEELYPDVIIQVEAVLYNDVEDNNFGVVCRGDSDNGSGYYFLLSGSGYYSILKDLGDSSEWLVEWTSSRLINQGQRVNQITAVCAGSYLALYVNNRLMVETEDSELADGFFGMTAGAYEAGDVEVSFDNLVVWEAGLEGRGSGAAPLITLRSHAGEAQDAVAELVQLGIIPRGGSLLFRESRAFFTGQGNFFTPLARRSSVKNVVMAAEMTFITGSQTDLEQCSLLARVNTDTQGTAVRYVDVALVNDALDSLVVLFDYFSATASPDVTIADVLVDISRPRHVLFTLVDGTANVFIDGRQVIANQPITESAGSFGIALRGRGAGARCEGRNIWVYQLP